MFRIDARSIQHALKLKGHYTGAIDGVIGPRSRAAIDAALAVEGIATANWLADRRLIAFEQLMMREAGIDCGRIDGSVGPQTLYGYELWQNRLRDIEAPEETVRHQPTMWPRQIDVPKYFGAVGENQDILELPYEMELAWEPATRIRKITVHRKVRDSLGRVLARVAANYTAEARRALGLDQFGGTLSVRKMRGGTAWSMHSWGIAIDIDPLRNQLRWGRNQANLDRSECTAFRKAFTEEGWISLGEERNYDWMHFQAARL